MGCRTTRKWLIVAGKLQGAGYHVDVAEYSLCKLWGVSFVYIFLRSLPISLPRGYSTQCHLLSPITTATKPLLQCDTCSIHWQVPGRFPPWPGTQPIRASRGPLLSLSTAQLVLSPEGCFIGFQRRPPSDENRGVDQSKVGHRVYRVLPVVVAATVARHRRLRVPSLPTSLQPGYSAL